MSMLRNARSLVAASGFLSAALISSALAQPATPAKPAAPATTAAPAASTSTTSAATPTFRSTGVPQRDTLIKMMRPTTIEFKEQRLEEVMNFIIELTGADIEIMWSDDKNSSGLEKDTQINLKSSNLTALVLLERVLEKAAAGGGTISPNSWQFTESGTLQVGPKERLNAYRRVEMYPINDLLQDLPDYTQAPEFDLQSVLQNRGGRGGGGGGSQSPFRDNNQGQTTPKKPMDERAEDLKKILIGLVETEQWQDNGGSGASIQYYQGQFLVNAPDYVHRQLNGYPYWPASATRTSTVGGRRYVSLGMDSSIAKIKGFTNYPITAVVGGQLVPSAPPGGGGQTAPATRPPKGGG